MAPVSFTSAVLIFVNQWLVGLSAFGIAASTIFLYVLGAAGAGAVGASVAVSLICAALTIMYLIMQSINASQLRHRQWHGSWLAQACVQLPRILIVCWLVTTAISLWKVVNLSLCRETHAGTNDNNAWQQGLGCWVFRILVSLDVVVLIFSFSLFVSLEIKGRHIPIGLFHFEHTPITPARQRRRTLMASAYGESTENLTPTSLEKRPTISPSPTYRTYDRRPSGRSVADQESILDLSTSRRSTCTTATLATLPMSALSLTSLPVPRSYPSLPSPMLSKPTQQTTIQSLSRPLSNSQIPPLPASYISKLAELERLEAEHLAATAAIGSSISPVKVGASSTAGVYIRSSSSAKIKSSCALPLERESMNDQPLTDTDVPPPAWCPALERAPLSSDPAIKRLTDLRRHSLRQSRRMSLGGFEFGFSRKSVHKRLASCASVVSRAEGEEKGNEKRISGKAAESASNGRGKARAKSAAGTRQSYEEDKENVTPKSMGGASVKSMGGRKRAMSQSQMKDMPDMPPPPIPERASARMSVGAGRRRGKSMVERGRFENLPR